MATIIDVAKKAQVSPSTVSRLLNDGYVKKETKTRILRAIKELNYTPSSKALNLRYGYTHTIGCITPKINTDFCAEVLDGIETALTAHGFNLILLQAQTAASHEEMNNTTLLREQKVDGIILVSPREISDEELSAIKNDDLPFILVEGDPQTGLACVVPNNHHGGYLATEHLIKQGHRRIALITGPEHWYSCRERLRGYRDALTNYGFDFDPDLVVCGDMFMDRGFELTRQLLALPSPPTGFFGINDYTAIGVLKALDQAGISVPEEAGVVGFDGILINPYLKPSLTSVRQPMFELGETAATRLVSMIKNKKVEQALTILPVELIARESSTKV